MIKTWLNVRPFGMWILGETHLSFEVAVQFNTSARGVWLRLPECKARNSWRWLLWRISPNRPLHSLRWTLPYRAEAPSPAQDQETPQ